MSKILCHVTGCSSQSVEIHSHKVSKMAEVKPVSFFTCAYGHFLGVIPDTAGIEQAITEQTQVLRELIRRTPELPRR